MREAASGAPVRQSAGAREVLGVLDARVTAVSYVRFHQPFEHLRDRGYRLRTLDDRLRLVREPGGWAPDPELLDGISLLIFPQMVAAPALPDGTRLHLVEPLCEMARRRGIKVVYSVDDYLPHIRDDNPGYSTIAEAAGNLATLLHASDAHFVTTEPLRESLARHGKPVFLLPNAVDFDRWSLRPRRTGELRIGWAGSSSHLADLLIVLPALERLQRKIPFRFVLFGLIDRPIAKQLAEIDEAWSTMPPAERRIADQFREVAAALDRIDHRHVPFVDTPRFFDVLPSLDFDIGICPLADTPFNRHKSANKFYEYAATGSMTVASDVPPYRDEVSALAGNDVDAWYETLQRYLLDRDAREAELAAQRDFVMTHRDIGTVKKRWQSALDAVLAIRPQEARA